MALLPLLGVSGASNRSALVWTLSPDEAEHLLECPDEEFLEVLQDRFGYRLGRLQQVGQRNAYPLSLVKSAEQVRQGVVVMGNAAHALHPVAGQGYNLALRDVAAVFIDGRYRTQVKAQVADVYSPVPWPETTMTAGIFPK